MRMRKRVLRERCISWEREERKEGKCAGREKTRLSQSVHHRRRKGKRRREERRRATLSEHKREKTEKRKPNEKEEEGGRQLRLQHPLRPPRPPPLPRPQPLERPPEHVPVAALTGERRRGGGPSPGRPPPSPWSRSAATSTPPRT